MSQAKLQNSVDTLCALDEESLTTVLQSVLNARPEVAPAVVAFAVPDLTYPPSRALTDNRQSGIVKSFNETGGFGFINCPELYAVFGGDVFYHRTQIGSFGVGETVNFAVILNKHGKPQAYDIQGGSSKGKGKAGGDGGAAAGGQSKGGWVNLSGGFKGDGGNKGSGGLKGASKSDKGKGKGTWEPKKGTGEVPEDAELLGAFTGSVKSYSWTKAYGFIECEEIKNMYGHDVFVLGDDIGAFDRGSGVGFTAFLNKLGKPQAVALEADASAAAPEEAVAQVIPAKRMRVV